MTRRLTGIAALGILTATAACGSTSDIGSSTPNGGATSLCSGQQAAPHYSNGIATVPGAATSLSGAGSTFVNPMMSVWASAYDKATGTQVAYQSVGSGAGIKQLQAATVDFGDSDAYMKDSDIAKAKGPVIQIPLVLAPVVVAYNVPGQKGGLQFDGETLGKIFAGKITNWNDPAIAALNPGVTLPNLAIAVAHRSDGSGTTDIFTDFLTKTSPTWVTALGGATQSRGKTVAWPVGIGGKGNDGVSAAINQTSGGIGYVELAYAIQQNLTYAHVKNHGGQYIEPCAATVSAATDGFQYPSDLRFDLTDSPATNAYPITGTTWALIYTNQTDPAKAAALVNFFSWVLTSGEDMTGQVDYTPVGKDLQAICMAQLRKVSVNGAAVAR